MKSLLVATLFVCLRPLPAATVDCSNLTAGDASVLLCETDGEPIPAGCFVRLGTFVLAGEIESLLASSGIGGVIATMEPFGEAFTVGQGAEQTPGNLEVEANQAVPADGSAPFGNAPIHLLVLNGPDVDASTEILLLRFPGSAIPSDGVGELPGLLALHVRDAEVVLGTSTSEGLRAASDATASSYANWIQDKLGNAQPELLTLTADGDADGASNLVEYGLGGDVTDGSKDAVLTFDLSGTTPQLTFLRRTDDAQLEHLVELCQDLAADVWEPYTGPIGRDDGAPDLPPGFTRALVSFSNRERCFARVRLEYP
jgi:hypothetical protein